MTIKRPDVMDCHLSQVGRVYVTLLRDHCYCTFEHMRLIEKTIIGMKGGIPPRADEGWRQLRTRNRGVPTTRSVREPL